MSTTYALAYLIVAAQFEPRRRVDKALYAVVMEAYTGSVSKSELGRICQGLDEQVKAFLGGPLDQTRFRYVCLDDTYSTAVWSRAGRWCRGPLWCRSATAMR